LEIGAGDLRSRLFRVDLYA